MIEKIPKNEDFCAPQYTNADVATIIECTNAKDAASCMPKQVKYDPTATTAAVYVPPAQCMWYRAAVHANNTELVTPATPLFESNFCHPA